MFELDTYLQTLYDLHGSDECVLVGLGLELPKLLLGMNFQKIVVAEADLREIEKVSKVYDLSERFLITDSLIAKDDTNAKFQIASNPSANTFADIEYFREIYPNIELKEILEKPSISLDTFMANNNLKNAKWLILNTLNSKTLLEQNDLKKFDVIVCKILKSELSELQIKLEEDDFKHLRCFEKQNPKILWSIFVKDTKKLTAQKEQELQERLKQTTDEKERTAKQLQEEQTKVKELTENFTKSKEELESLKKLTAQKEQELQERLKQTTDEKERTAKQLQEEHTKVKEVTENLTKSKEELEALKKLTAKKEQELDKKNNELLNMKNASSKDDDIDDFIKDIKPFYYGKNITYIDIGAFTGDVFLKFKKYLKIREAHLFEPNPKSFEILNENISNVKIPLLHVYNNAIGDKKDQLLFSYEASMTKQVNIIDEKINENDFFKSDIYPLSAFEDTITDKKINLLKVDVEGYELNVLKGCIDFFKNKQIDIVYIEVGFNKDATQQTYFTEIDNFMQAYDYRVFKIYEQMNEWISDSPLLRRCNFAYMSSDFAAKNSLKLVEENYLLKQQLNKIQEVK